jgi:hypothetical protein
MNALSSLILLFENLLMPLQLQTQLLDIQSKPNGKVHTVAQYIPGILKETDFLEGAIIATYVSRCNMYLVT